CGAATLSWCREAAAFALALTAAGQAGATEWAAGGVLSARGEVISNPALSVPASDRAHRLSLGGDASLAARAEAWDATVSGGLTRHLSDDATLEKTDARAGLQAARRFETGSVNTGLSYLRDSTRASEAGETGIVLTRAQRDSYSAMLGGR